MIHTLGNITLLY